MKIKISQYATGKKKSDRTLYAVEYEGFTPLAPAGRKQTSLRKDIISYEVLLIQTTKDLNAGYSLKNHGDIEVKFEGPVNPGTQAATKILFQQFQKRKRLEEVVNDIRHTTGVALGLVDRKY